MEKTFLHQIRPNRPTLSRLSRDILMTDRGEQECT